MSVRAIGAMTGHDRKTIRKYLGKEPGTAPTYGPRAPRPPGHLLGTGSHEESFYGMLEQGPQAPSPAPDLMPGKHEPRTNTGIGSADGGTSRACSSLGETYTAA